MKKFIAAAAFAVVSFATASAAFAGSNLPDLKKDWCQLNDTKYPRATTPLLKKYELMAVCDGAFRAVNFKWIDGPLDNTDRPSSGPLYVNGCPLTMGEWGDRPAYLGKNRSTTCRTAIHNAYEGVLDGKTVLVMDTSAGMYYYTPGSHWGPWKLTKAVTPLVTAAPPVAEAPVAKAAPRKAKVTPPKRVIVAAPAPKASPAPAPAPKAGAVPEKITIDGKVYVLSE